MLVEPGGDLAQLLEGADEIAAFVGLVAGQPVEQHAVARPRHAGARDVLDQFAVLAGQRDRRRHACFLAQRLHPGELAADAVLGVIVLAVDPERPPAAARRGVDPVGHVFRVVDQADAGVRGQLVGAEGVLRQLADPFELPLRAQVVEGFHADSGPPSP
jgi:hypothetical protein